MFLSKLCLYFCYSMDTFICGSCRRSFVDIHIFMCIEVCFCLNYVYIFVIVWTRSSVVHAVDHLLTFIFLCALKYVFV